MTCGLLACQMTQTQCTETHSTMSGKGFGFSLGKMKELTEAFKKAQQVQEGAKELQEELERMEIEGQAGGGMVKVVLTGNQEPLRTEISAEALGEGAEVLSDLVTAAMKEAYQKSTETMRGRMEELTSGLNIPGL
jgi:nucleoid-associated protein EbfC